jgi:hypothetical protein
MRMRRGGRRWLEWAADLGFAAALASTLFTPTILCWFGQPGMVGSQAEVWRYGVLRWALTGPLALLPMEPGGSFWAMCAAPTGWVAMLALGMRMGAELPGGWWRLGLAPVALAQVALVGLYAGLGYVGWEAALWMVALPMVLTGAGLWAARESAWIEREPGLAVVGAALAAHLGAPLVLKLLGAMGHL